MAQKNKYTINILDVGARAGINSILPNWVPTRAMRCYVEHIRFFGIEPDPEEAERLETQGNYEKVFKLALSDVHGERTLYVTREPDKSSILEPDLEVIKDWFTESISSYEVVKRIAVHTTTIDKLFEDSGIIFDWVKIDTQGSEYEVLQGANKTLNDTTVILTELSAVKQYINQKTTVEFISEINKIGFDILLVNYKPIMSCENDIVFIRKLNTITNYRQIFSLANCFSMFNLEGQKNFLLDKVAPKILSNREISEIRQIINLSERRFFEISNKKKTFLEKIKYLFS
jgi:FkbM family methyltransferase